MAKFKCKYGLPAKQFRGKITKFRPIDQHYNYFCQKKLTGNLDFTQSLKAVDALSGIPLEFV